MSRHAFLNMVVVILALVAGVLGYLVYEKYAPVETVGEAAKSSGLVNANSDSLDYSALTDAELVAVLPNSSEASPEVLQAFSTEADSRAKDASRVVIGANCAADPVIAAVTLGGQVTFQNEDDRPHTLQLTPEISVVLPAGGSETVTIDFETGSGMYGYPCDNYMVLAGMLVVR